MAGTAAAHVLETLYESATTRVVRCAPGVICKEPLGADAARRLHREAEMLARLAGVAGVVQLAPGTPHEGSLALKDCQGTALAQLLRESGPDMDWLLALAPRLARVLAEVHRTGVVHRDINPANILLTPQGEPVLIDFELAVPAEHHPEAAQDGRIVGTLAYIAPEQTGRTGRAVDHRADLYALGATLYELVTGALPFETQDTLQLIHDHLVREPVPPAQLDARVPQGLSRIIARLLAKAPEQRYESLEQRVQARTRELEQTQAELVATARRAGKAEIANNVLHNVGNVLNSINVSASSVRQAIDNPRLEGLARAVALIQEHAHDLGRFVESDARGKVLVTYLGDLVRALEAEKKNALADLARLASSVEHVAHVVARQQSHAGPSSVLEIAQPQQLMEEALRLSAETTARYGIQVVRRYEEVPATALDKPRMLQILVNLIGNAAQAMEGVPPASRLLTLGSALVHEADGDRLRITVRDEGEGIAPENLARLFAHGFTTRKSGHGFGLHSSALAAMEMGGKLTAHSAGLGQGAVFALELPLRARDAVG